MHVIVAGCGRVGSQLALSLSYEAHDVVVIDKDASSFRRLGGTFNGITLEGVAFDEEVLLEAGIESADAFAAVTNHDNTNLMTAEIATNIYRVPTVISRLYEPGRELTFFKMGIDYVCSTTLIAERIREKLFQREDMIIQQDRLDIGVQVVELEVPQGADGKSAGGLNSGVSAKLIAVLREGKVTDWNEDAPLRSGDRVIVSLRKEGWRVVADCFGEAWLEGAFHPDNIIFPSGDASRTGEAPRRARIVVGGCSAVGSHLAYLLSMDGHRVTVIDRNPELFKRLPKKYEGNVLEGTVYEEEVLTRAGIDEADAFTAVTKFDNTNLMASEVAKHVFGVPNVLARLFNPDKEETYQALGMNYICGTKFLSQVLLERILRPRVRVRISCFNNLLDLVEFECHEPWKGKSVGFLEEKLGMRFAYIARRNSGYMPDENFLLHKGDSITALATTRRVQKLNRLLRKR